MLFLLYLFCKNTEVTDKTIANNEVSKEQKAIITVIKSLFSTINVVMNHSPHSNYCVALILMPIPSLACYQNVQYKPKYM